MKRIIYPARRAVEHAVSIPGVRPLRLFPVLWPLWQVQTSANVYDEQAYDLIDHFLLRAVAEAGIDTTTELVRFLALQPPLVQRCLRFLAVIGHVRAAGDHVELTDLGRRSLRAGVRYEPKESRQIVLIECYTGQPLPRRYYDGAVTVLATREVPPDQVADGSRFLPLFAPTWFRDELATGLAHHPDRASLNLPSQLRDLRVLAHRDGYLPAYLVETASHGLLAYTAAAEDRDDVLEQACRAAGAAGDLIEAEGVGDPRTIWTAWLADQGLGATVLRQLPTGVWRAILPSSAFGEPPKLAVSRVGSFQLRQYHFLQVWCDDAQLRRRALLDRALGVASLPEVTTRDELDRRVRRIAGGLEVPAPTLDELREHATRTGAADRRAHLDALDRDP